jgi:hypothetical protein
MAKAFNDEGPLRRSWEAHRMLVVLVVLEIIRTRSASGTTVLLRSPRHYNVIPQRGDWVAIDRDVFVVSNRLWDASGEAVNLLLEDRDRVEPHDEAALEQRLRSAGFTEWLPWPPEVDVRP